MSKSKSILVQGKVIHVTQIDNEDYISLTDMIAGFEGGSALIENWIRTKSTLEFLAVWETLNNPDFNSLEFEGIRTEAGSNRFSISVKQWIQRTCAVGVRASTGRYGGTYAHKDIAFEFGSWLSPQFKLYLIKEFQRLKEDEGKQNDLEWNVKRILSKVNYRLHTDAVKEHIVPTYSLPKEKEGIIYANEAELLNYALFGTTAREWKEKNPKLALQGLNLRDQASLSELTVLSNLEIINSLLIAQKTPSTERVKFLQERAREQLSALEGLDYAKGMKRLENKN